MDRTAASSVTSSSVSNPRQYLELSLISAEDLPPVTKSMRTYAMAWFNPNRKYTTGTDHEGHVNPTWSDKFRFRLDKQTITSDDAAITIEIYALARFRDAFVGTARVPIADYLQNQPNTVKFTTVQIRRQSGTPQGKLHIGVSVVDSNRRRKSTRQTRSEDGMMNSHQTDDNEAEAVQKDVEVNPSVQDEVVVSELEKKKLEEKIRQWWNKSIDVEQLEEDNGGSIYNSSIVNGSELLSDIGPSPSVVANQLAAFRSEIASAVSIGRRHSDVGLFSCFVYGIELRVSCGAPNQNPKGYRRLKPAGSIIGKTTKKLLPPHSS